jgi:RB1-inducible coiled-coil protein 1
LLYLLIVPHIDTDLKSEVDRCLDLPAEYKTVVKRAQLAQNFLELAKEELHICDKLVHEQHLQHQGWMAVVS